MDATTERNELIGKLNDIVEVIGANAVLSELSVGMSLDDLRFWVNSIAADYNLDEVE